MGRDVELFAQHAGRKSVNTEDVILSGNSKPNNLILDILFVRVAQQKKSGCPLTEVTINVSVPPNAGKSDLTLDSAQTW